MEKKRTKIAYFTAVGVFLVLLVVLGLTYRETPLPTLEVEGEPVLAHTLRAIDAATLVDEIILSTRTECLAEMAELFQVSRQAMRIRLESHNLL